MRAVVLVLALVALFCTGVMLVLRHAGATLSEDWAGGTEAAASPSATPTEVAEAALATQSRALFGGDEQGWLSIVDPADTALVDTYRRQFRILHGLHVTRWYQTVRGVGGSGYAGYKGLLVTEYCLADPGCPQGADPVGDDAGFVLVSNLTWTVSGGAVRVTGMTAATEGRLGDASPLRADLAVAEGKRVVVAAPQALAGVLPKAVAAGDAAAGVVDGLARFYPPPDRYVLFLAGKDEYNSWFNSLTVLSSAFTIAGHHNAQIVVDLGAGWKTDTASTMQHEMGHAVTLQGAKQREPLWFVEGIAQYIQFHGRSPAQSGLLPVARAYLRSGAWNGHLAVDFDDRRPDGLLATAGHYAVSYLGVRCLAESYGEDRMFALFDTVVRKGGSDPSASAVAALGVPWETADQRCTADIRTTAG